MGHKRLDNSETIVIIIQDAKDEYRMELRKRYSGKILLTFQNGIFQGGKKEDPFLSREIPKNRSLKNRAGE